MKTPKNNIFNLLVPPTTIRISLACEGTETLITIANNWCKDYYNSSEDNSSLEHELCYIIQKKGELANWFKHVDEYRVLMGRIIEDSSIKDFDRYAESIFKNIANTNALKSTAHDLTRYLNDMNAINNEQPQKLNTDLEKLLETLNKISLNLDDRFIKLKEQVVNGNSDALLNIRGVESFFNAQTNTVSEQIEKHYQRTIKKQKH